MVYKKQINGATVLLVHRKMQQGLKINFLKRTYGLKILEASYRWSRNCAGDVIVMSHHNLESQLIAMRHLIAKEGSIFNSPKAVLILGAHTCEFH